MEEAVESDEYSLAVEFPGLVGSKLDEIKQGEESFASRFLPVAGECWKEFEGDLFRSLFMGGDKEVPKSDE